MVFPDYSYDEALTLSLAFRVLRKDDLLWVAGLSWRGGYTLVRKLLVYHNYDPRSGHEKSFHPNIRTKRVNDFITFKS